MFLNLSILALLACSPETTLKEPETRLVMLGYRDPDPGLEPFPLPEHPPTLGWSFDIEEDQFVVSWSIHNPSDQDIWLFDGLTSARDHTVLDRTRLQVGNGRARHSARMFLGFSGRRACFTKAREMEATWIPAGATHFEVRKVPLPLDGYDPIFEVLNPLPRVEVLELAMGWTLNGPGLPELIAGESSRPRLDPYVGLSRQRWLLGEPIRLTEAEIEAINP